MTDKSKYVGIYVYASRRNTPGIYGTITDIIQDENNPEVEWFIVANTDESSEEKYSRWSKNELKKVIVTTKLVKLD